MTTKRDYYDVLGVHREASEEEIRKAFRRLALEFHPDRNRDARAEERFKEVNEAYQVLTNPEKRATYDRFGHAGVTVADGSWQGFEGVDTLGGLGDIFDAFFGGFGVSSQQRVRRGRDLQSELTIAFEEAVLGAEKALEVTRQEVCSRCKGSRGEPGTSAQRCGTCRGTGQVQRSQRSLFGQFVQVVTCPTCHGEGQVIPQPCVQCRGSGQERHKRVLEVVIPAGVEDGTQLRLAGEGEAGGPGGHPGDLYVTLHVQRHPFFQRQENDLLYELSINFAQAALGDTVEIPTLEGKQSLRVPAGVQNGTTLRLKEKGVPRVGGGRRGDLLVAVRVVTPESVDPETRRLFEALAKKLGQSDNDSQQTAGWRGRFKVGPGGSA